MFGVSPVSHNIHIDLAYKPHIAAVTSVETYVFRQTVLGQQLQRQGDDAVTYTHVSLTVNAPDGITTLYTASAPNLSVLSDISAGSKVCFAITYETPLKAVMRLSPSVMPDEPARPPKSSPPTGGLLAWVLARTMSSSAPSPPVAECQTKVVVQYIDCWSILAVEPLIADTLQATWTPGVRTVTSTWLGSDVVRDTGFGVRVVCIDKENAATGGFVSPVVPMEPVLCLVDCSASMAGLRLAAVRDAVRALLHSLPRGTPVNVYAFGSTFTALFDAGTTQPLSPHLLATVIDPFVAALQADLGGTDLPAVLRRVFREHPRHDTNVVVVTDSEPVAVTAVGALCRAHKHCKVFAVGVGSSQASVPLLRALAPAGKPTPRVVTDLAKLSAELLNTCAPLLV